MILALTSLSVPVVSAQEATPHRPAALTAADYAAAERFLATHTSSLVLGGAVRATWVADDGFWYQNRFSGGTEYLFVDAADGTRTRAVDHEAIIREKRTWRVRFSRN